MFPTCIESFETIYKICAFFLIVPRWDFKTNRLLKFSLLFQIIAHLIVIGCLTVSFPFMMYTFAKLLNSPDYKSHSLINLRLLPLFFLVVGLVIWDGRNKKWGQMLSIIRDNRIFTTKSPSKTRTMLYLLIHKTRFSIRSFRNDIEQHWRFVGCVTTCSAVSF